MCEREENQRPWRILNSGCWAASDWHVARRIGGESAGGSTWDEQDSLRHLYAQYLEELAAAKKFVDYDKTAYALESGAGAVPPPSAAAPQ